MTETERILEEYERRAREVPADRYAPWAPAEAYMRASRRYRAARLLAKCGHFPGVASRCLEIGPGAGGWLPELVSWGVPTENLAAIDLRSDAVRTSRSLLPGADVRLGDARELPWPDRSFDLVIASTVFSSILDDEARVELARAMRRVLSGNGCILWYDFFWSNPGNRGVRPIGARELRRLFAPFRANIESTTLAPPIARQAPAAAWPVLFALERIPFLRTHLIAVLYP